MDPREFHRLASQLVGGTSPAEFRTAISRAYYAAYNVAVEILEDMGFRVSKGPAGHGEVQHRLSNSGNTDVIRVGSQLVDLHSRRIQADYRLDRTDVENLKTVRSLVEQARRMIQTLDGCRAEPQRTQIIAAIRDWERKVSSQGNPPKTG
jgi:hypothetical protein